MMHFWRKMDKRVITDNTNNFQRFGSPSLSAARCQGKAKKKPETDAIFGNVLASKCRGGCDRKLCGSAWIKSNRYVENIQKWSLTALEPLKALDHDMQPKESLCLVAFLTSKRQIISFLTSSYKTSDFWLMTYALVERKKQELPDLKQ